jgi:hypothetical protein
MLAASGLCAPNGEVNDLLVSMLAGEYVGKLVDTLISEDVETEPLLLSLKAMLQDEDYMGIYFFLLYLFSAVEMEPPRLFLQLPANKSALNLYLREVVADFEDSREDQ